MDFNDILISEKQKKKCLDKVLSSFLSAVKSGKRKGQSYKSHLISFHNALIALPYPFQVEEALKWTEAVDSSGINPSNYSFSSKEKEAYDYIRRVSMEEADFYAEMLSLQDKIKQDISEMNEILKSRRFKCARKLCPKNARLSLGRYSKYKSFES